MDDQHHDMIEGILMNHTMVNDALARIENVDSDVDSAMKQVDDLSKDVNDVSTEVKIVANEVKSISHETNSKIEAAQKAAAHAAQAAAQAAAQETAQTKQAKAQTKQTTAEKQENTTQKYIERNAHKYHYNATRGVGGQDCVLPTNANNNGPDYTAPVYDCFQEAHKRGDVPFNYLYGKCRFKKKCETGPNGTYNSKYCKHEFCSNSDFTTVNAVDQVDCNRKCNESSTCQYSYYERPGTISRHSQCRLYDTCDRQDVSTSCDAIHSTLQKTSQPKCSFKNPTNNKAYNLIMRTACSANTTQNHCHSDENCTWGIPQ